MKIAVVGTSHVAAWKMGWNEIADQHPGVDVTFFAVPLQMISVAKLGPDKVLRFGGPRKKIVREARQFARKITGKDNLDLSGFDRIVRVGIQPPIRLIVELMIEFDIDGFAPSGGRQQMSAAAFRAMIDSFIKDRLPDGHWRGFPDGQVIVAEVPAWSAEGLTSHRKLRKLHKRTADLSTALAYKRQQTAEMTRAAGFGFAPQPPESLTDDGLTRAEFARGAQTMRGAERPVVDVHHMNPDYGVLCWKGLLADLGVS